MGGYRTHGAGALGSGEVGARVTLAGWAATVRDHGGLIFVDLRDATGIAQVVFDPKAAPDAQARAKRLSVEDVIQVTGSVARRPPGTENRALGSGEVEVRAETLTVINETLPLPFPLAERTDASEEVRLKYRYLDLRRPGGSRGLLLRHRAMQACRGFLSGEGFVEVETPMLWKSTPEGAREFVIPSRVYPGRFYALPQSPQLMKQTLMVAGLDRYFQIARCFRDEDLRADRQPEFTQIDVEMAFVEEEDVFRLVEGMMARIFESAGRTFPLPVPRLTYREAMASYGTDKPDLRFDMKIGDATSGLAACASDLIRKAVSAGSLVKAVALPGAVGDLPRSRLDELDLWAKEAGSAGLSWFRAGAAAASPLMRRLAEAEREGVARACGAAAGDWIFVAFDAPDRVEPFMGALRLALAQRFGLVGGGFRPLWVREFPLLTWNEEERRWGATHHMFTRPFDEDVAQLASRPETARGHHYDLVINGMEVLGGSLRIHRADVQRRVFETCGYTPETYEERMGFLLQALSYGAPPHGGFASGFDRLVMLLGGFESIRDTIAFPKTQRGVCLLSSAPGPVDARQLGDLHVRIVNPPGRDRERG